MKFFKYLLFLLLFISIEFIHSVIVLAKCDFYNRELLFFALIVIGYLIIWKFMNKKEKLVVLMFLLASSLWGLSEKINIDFSKMSIYYYSQCNSVSVPIKIN